MTGEGDEEFWQVLDEYRMSREGLHVKLDRGFEEGTYCIYVEFNDLASRVGVAAAHRRAGEYCGLLKAQLDRFAGHSLGKTEDASRRAGPGRNRDLELTYLTFPVVMADGRFHDNAVLKVFRTAVLRTGQQWDQAQARIDTKKQERRRDAFRLRFGELLAGDTYQHLDKVTKDRLLDKVPELAFPPRGHEL